MWKQNTGDCIQVVRFSVADREFAFDVMSVLEVISPRPSVSLPGQPSFVHGVVDLRGTYLPLVDLRKRFAIGTDTPAGKFIIVRCQQRRLVLMVDGIGEVVWLAKSALQEAPVQNELGGTKSISWLSRVEESMVTILDADHLLHEEEMVKLPSEKKS